MKQIRIGSKLITEKSDPFVIAEIGVNHFDIAKKLNLSTLNAAKLMIKHAVINGADAVKFQSYKANKLASKNSPSYWDTKKEKTKSQFELFKKYDQFGKREYSYLAKYTHKVGAAFMSTPFDEESADYLSSLMPAYKISSADITNKMLLERISKKNKPILLSTGASTKEEIKEAINLIKKNNSKIALLHCILNYPTPDNQANLRMINDLVSSFPNYIVGYSDHTQPDDKMLILSTAYLFGAQIIEKHFTLDKSLPGNDHYHAMDPDDLKMFVTNINLIQKIKGLDIKCPINSEKKAIKNARRSLYASRKISKGEVITKNTIIAKRPGTGISPMDINKIIGKKINRDLNEDELFSWGNISRK